MQGILIGGVHFMKIGVVHFTIKPDKLPDYKKLWDGFVIELRKEVPGFRSALLLIDSKTGKGESIGFYDSEESAKKITTLASFHKFLEDLRPFLVGETTRDMFDVGSEFELVSKKAA
jgi:hypothetical protein